MPFLDKTGLAHLWTQIIARLNGYVTKEQLPGDINDALAQAKESGEFDGATPVRGTDYWTDADKAEIKAYIDEAILGGEW